VSRAPGSIRKAYEACCAATGRPIRTARVGALVTCPFHADGTASFSLREATETFNCFGCNKKGGLFALVVEFDLASNFSEASAWLADRGIVPAPVSQGNEKPEYTPEASFLDCDLLPDELRTFRVSALLDLDEAIGPVRLRLGRDAIGIMRFRREAPERERWATICAQLKAAPEYKPALAAVLSHPLGFDSETRDAIWREMLPKYVGPGTCAHHFLYRDACAECERPAHASYETETA
jgi:hypothetical protein